MPPGRRIRSPSESAGKNFYLVNRESFPVRVSFRLNSDAMTDLVTRETRKGKNRKFELTVPGQGLLVFASDGAADARITEILQQVRDSDLKLLRDQLLNLDDAVKISHSAQLLRHRQILHDRMEKKQYTEARRYLYRKEVQNALKSLGICQVKGKLLPLENRFLVEIQSLRREPLNAVVNISRTTGCWNVDPRKKQRVANLKTGEKTTLKFDLEDAASQRRLGRGIRSLRFRGWRQTDEIPLPCGRTVRLPHRTAENRIRLEFLPVQNDLSQSQQEESAPPTPIASVMPGTKPDSSLPSK